MISGENPEPGTQGNATALPSSFRAWSTVAILLVFSLVSYLDRQLVALLVDPIKHDLVLTDTELGLLQGVAFALLYGFAGIPIGWAVDRRSRRGIIYLGITVWSLAAASCGLARSFWQFFLGRVFVGIGEATMNPVAVSLIGDLFPRDKVAAPLGLYSSGLYLGGGVAMAIGGWVIGLFAGQSTVLFPLIGTVAPWQATFIVIGLPGVLIAFLALLMTEPRASRRMRASSLDGIKDDAFLAFLASRKPLVICAFAAFGLTAFLSYAIASWTPAFFMRVHGWAPKDVGAIIGMISGLAGTIGALGGGVFMDRACRTGHSDTYFVSAALAAAIGAVVFPAAFLVAQPMVTLSLLTIGFGAFGVTAVAAYSTWHQIAPPEFRGRLTACYVLVAAITGIGLGPFATGFVTDYVMGEDRLVGQSISLISALGFPVVAILLWRGRSLLTASQKP